jgi:glycosyltransferase involved in cell wall biosynthesis
VRDGVTGIVVTPDDVVAAADALRSLLGDAVRCKAMGDAARAAVVEYYNWDRVARETSDFADRVTWKQT